MKKIICLLLTFILTVSMFTACAQQPAEETLANQETLSDEEVLAERRNRAEAQMRKEMTVLWRADTDIIYSKKAASAGIDADEADQIVKIVAGRVYQGMPYAHGAASVYSWLSFAESQDSKGVYTLSGLEPQMLSGGPYEQEHRRARLSNDCADAIFWAWASVSSSIYFPGAGTMFETHGCLKVGEYESVEKREKDTKEICKQNGEEVMFAAYAQMQKADAVTKSEHAMMIVEVHVVENDGKIDADQSYATVLEQISSNLMEEKYYYNEELQENVYLCGGVDIKYTFRELFDKGYLPVTCKEFIDPSPLAEETVADSVDEHTKDTILKGYFQSPYRISSVTITITDKDGKVVQQMTGFSLQSEMLRFRLPRMGSEEESSVVVGKIDVSALTAGTYRCTHVCQISTGSKITVRDFQFTV